MFDVPPPHDGVRGMTAYRETWPGFFEWQANGASFEIVELDVTAGEDVAFAWALLEVRHPGRARRDTGAAPSPDHRASADKTASGSSPTSTTRSRTRRCPRRARVGVESRRGRPGPVAGGPARPRTRTWRGSAYLRRRRHGRRWTPCTRRTSGRSRSTTSTSCSTSTRGWALDGRCRRSSWAAAAAATASSTACSSRPRSERLGYDVERRLGRVGDPAVRAADPLRASLVTLDGERLLADPGFGMSAAPADRLGGRGGGRPRWLAVPPPRRCPVGAGQGWALRAAAATSTGSRCTPTTSCRCGPVDLSVGHHFTSTVPDHPLPQHADAHQAPRAAGTWPSPTRR